MAIAEIPSQLSPAPTETAMVARVRLLTVEDVAEFLQVKPARVYEAVKQRRLRALRVGRLLRFRTQDVEAFLDRSATREGMR
jgi:excisionase family DNA binding protein